VVSESTWPRGAATGVGSLPGTDIREAVKLVFGELTALPHLPELPARGPGADMIGRGAGLLSGLPVELYAGRWRFASRPGRDLRRTLDLLDRDLNALTEIADGHVGPVKVQAPGPWTLAAGLELPVGGRVLRDHGATRDLAESLAEGLRAHVADVAARVPGASVLLQVDEPSLPAVLAGRVATESGLYTLNPVEANVAEAALRSRVDGVGVPVVVHCCAQEVPLALLRCAGAAGISLDLTVVGESEAVGEYDALAECIDAGLGLFVGAVPSTGSPPVSSARVADRVTTLWRRLGFPPGRIADQAVVTPACGLAGAGSEYARSALAACVEAGRRLADQGD
jgi:methionine synthase II (cobalamin-independent)